MAPKVLSASEWFDTFYPSEWGDWRKEYNIKAYREGQRETACTWMCYPSSVYLLREDESGQMKVCPSEWGATSEVETFFVSCGSQSGGEIAWFLQPYLQPADETYYAKVSVTRMDSNLDLYRVYIAGCDDSSYTRHFLGLRSVREEISYLKTHGVFNILDRDYFFTN